MILTNDETLAKRAKHITTTAKADPKEYFHDEIGYNYRLVNILAAMGVAQMEQLDVFLSRKKQIVEFYNIRLSQIVGFENQKVLIDVKPNYWLYTIKLPNAKELLMYLNDLKIEARPFWIPMNQLPANNQDIYFTETDVSNQIYDNCVSLPCSTSITDEELRSVVDAVLEFYD
jgi:perosamine synthetase